MTNTKYKVVYRMDYALKLIERGHIVHSTVPNPKNNKLMTWIFEIDNTLEQDLAQLMSDNCRGKEQLMSEMNAGFAFRDSYFEAMQFYPEEMQKEACYRIVRYCLLVQCPIDQDTERSIDTYLVYSKLRKLKCQYIFILF